VCCQFLVSLCYKILVVLLKKVFFILSVSSNEDFNCIVFLHFSVRDAACITT